MLVARRRVSLSIFPFIYPHQQRYAFVDGRLVWTTFLIPCSSILWGGPPRMVFEKVGDGRDLVQRGHCTTSPALEGMHIGCKVLKLFHESR